MTKVSIGRDAAIAMAATGWWKNLPAREVAEKQMVLQELAMDFSDFHKALEEALGRPVWTHELGLDYEGIYAELMGERPAPTFVDIVVLIPEDKRILIHVEAS